MKAQVKLYQCLHEGNCSQPGTYWRFRNYIELLDAHGNVTEIVMPDAIDNIDEDYGACTECGAPAHAKWVDQQENRCREGAEQGALL